MTSTQAFADALAVSPYAGFLGVEAVSGSSDRATMRFSPPLVGNPLLPALHGGSVAGFMELTATAALTAATQGTQGRPKPVDVSVAYLRSARPADTHARAQIRKVGRRIAYVHVLAWQEDEAAPVAEMTAHFLLADLDSTNS